MNPNDVLTNAWTAVKESGVPESLYEVAFREAVALVVGSDATRAQFVATATDRLAQSDRSEESTTSRNAGGGLFEIFASESNIAESDLIEIYYFDADGTPHLNVAGRKLGDSMTARARSAATLMSAAYFFVEDEVQVPIDKIRAECERLKCFDGKNFFSHMASAPGTVLSGSGTTRVLRTKSSEIEAALRSILSTLRGVSD